MIILIDEPEVELSKVSHSPRPRADTFYLELRVRTFAPEQLSCVHDFHEHAIEKLASCIFFRVEVLEFDGQGAQVLAEALPELPHEILVADVNASLQRQVGCDEANFRIETVFFSLMRFITARIPLVICDLLNDFLNLFLDFILNIFLALAILD